MDVFFDEPILISNLYNPNAVLKHKSMPSFVQVSFVSCNLFFGFAIYVESVLVR
jgi:hypothetical protein